MFFVCPASFVFCRACLYLVYLVVTLMSAHGAMATPHTRHLPRWMPLVAALGVLARYALPPYLLEAREGIPPASIWLPALGSTPGPSLTFFTVEARDLYTHPSSSIALTPTTRTPPMRPPTCSGRHPQARGPPPRLYFRGLSHRIAPTHSTRGLTVVRNHPFHPQAQPTEPTQTPTPSQPRHPPSHASSHPSGPRPHPPQLLSLLSPVQLGHPAHPSCHPTYTATPELKTWVLPTLLECYLAMRVLLTLVTLGTWLSSHPALRATVVWTSAPADIQMSNLPVNKTAFPRRPRNGSPLDVPLVIAHLLYFMLVTSLLLPIEAVLGLLFIRADAMAILTSTTSLLASAIASTVHLTSLLPRALRALLSRLSRSPLLRCSVLIVLFHLQTARACPTQPAAHAAQTHPLAVPHLPYAGALTCLLILLLLGSSAAVDAEADTGGTSRPPVFDGMRNSFTAWFVLFSAWVSWRISDSGPILDETEPEPPQPDDDNNAAERRRREEARADWRRRNRKLYGAIVMAMPQWLTTSLHLQQRNDGLAAIAAIRSRFDATDSNDRASAVRRLSASHIDPKADINETDLRIQMDEMLCANAALLRTGGNAMDDAIMISMFDNALPISYQTIRQMVRSRAHPTFQEHVQDYMAQVKAELAARIRSGPMAYLASHGVRSPGRPPPTGDRRPQRGNNPSRPAVLCLRCLRRGHLRRQCRNPITKCAHCNGDHHPTLCFATTATGSSDRDGLPVSAQNALRRESKGATTAPPSASRRPAARAATASASLQPPVMMIDINNADVHNADDPMHHSLGGFCVFITPAPPSLHPTPPLALSSRLVHHDRRVRAFVDSMATVWITSSTESLFRITHMRPSLFVEQLSGHAEVLAVGDACVYLRDNRGDLVHFIVRGVMVVPSASRDLYSSRIMFEQHRLRHAWDDACRIIIPTPPHLPPRFIPFQHTSSGYELEVTYGKPPPGAAAYNSSASPAISTGTAQSLAWRRLGYPFAQAWRHTPRMLLDTDLPEDVPLDTHMPMREEVALARSRALPFFLHPADKTLPAPGAVLYMDFAGPMPPSWPHRYVHYCGVVDAGSGYARVYPVRHPNREAAADGYANFLADLTSKLALTHQLKPLVVVSDNGGAFISAFFCDLLASQGVHQRLAAPYTPQQNSYVERMWGVTFGTARVLISAVAKWRLLLHPHAVQTARWLHNRLPTPSRNNLSPFFILTRTRASVAYLRCFGCLCRVRTPPATRQGDRHFADRATMCVYLGPSETSPAAVVLDLRSRRLFVSRDVICYEDVFPLGRSAGLRGEEGLRDIDATPPAVAPDPALTPPPTTPPAAPPTEPGASPTEEPHSSDPPSSPSLANPPDPPLDAPPADAGPDDLAPSEDPSSIHFQRQHPPRQRNSPQRLTYVALPAMPHQLPSLFSFLACVGGPVHAMAVTSVASSDLGEVPVPRNYLHAVTGPWKSYWRAAINKELDGLLRLNVWTGPALIPPPRRQRYALTLHLLGQAHSRQHRRQVQGAACRRRKHPTTWRGLRPCVLDSGQVHHHPHGVDHRVLPRLPHVVRRRAASLPTRQA